MTDDDQYMIRHELKRSVLEQMHAPIAYFIGGESDIAYANSETDWKGLQQRKVPALNAQMDVGHGATYGQPNGGPFVTAPRGASHRDGPLNVAHAAGAPVAGSGITLAAPLTRDHPRGAGLTAEAPTPGAPNRYSTSRTARP